MIQRFKYTFLVALLPVSIFFVPMDALGTDRAWAGFKASFLSSDGRIMDPENSSISHSEGQAYGLLISCLKDDEKTFELLWRWTRANLQKRRGDHLLCWSWGKRPNGDWDVLDYNNATDGDVIAAYALLLAGQRWGRNDYIDAGKDLVKDIREKLGLEWAGFTLLLPGYYGFSFHDHVVLNPSYIVPRAYELFGTVDKNAFWQKALRDGKTLLEKARFSQWRLPSDWIVLKANGAVLPEPERGRYFGFDAIRVFLFGTPKTEKEKEYLQMFYSHVLNIGYVPERVDILNGCLSMKEAPAGFYFVISRAFRKLGLEKEATWFQEKGYTRISQGGKGYYSSALVLLSQLLR